MKEVTLNPKMKTGSLMAAICSIISLSLAGLAVILMIIAFAVGRSIGGAEIPDFGLSVVAFLIVMIILILIVSSFQIVILIMAFRVLKLKAKDGKVEGITIVILSSISLLFTIISLFSGQIATAIPGLIINGIVLAGGILILLGSKQANNLQSPQEVSTKNPNQ